jgi:rhodanese-related sulfurtransferase
MHGSRLTAIYAKENRNLSLKKGVKQLWQEAMAEVETIDAATAVALHGQEGVVFVDIRDVRELEREGLIPKAVHAPRGMLEYWVDPDSKYHRQVFSTGKRFVLY